MTFLKRAIAAGHARITGEGKNQKITYVAARHSERFSDPEEPVRAEFWAELIYRYEYLPERIVFEKEVPRRVPGDWADLVVYRDDECKDAYIVVECKRDGISDAEFRQAIEQACGNRASLGAQFTGVVAGNTRRFLDFTKHKAGERLHNIVADLPIRYGKPPAFRFYKGVPGSDLEPVPREELIAAIRKCHQTLWEGGKRSAIIAFGEFCKLIFVKIQDELKPGRKKGEAYEFQTKTDELPKHLAARIRGLYANARDEDPEVFTENINVDDAILAQVVAHIESISLSKTDLDTKGVAFEAFMDGFFKGDFGQFFTPRPLIDFAVDMMEPRHDDLILDPACGSGGFLLYALDHIRHEANRLFPNHEKDTREATEHFRYWHDFAKNNLYGLEINDEIARVAKMNMIIHDDGHTNVLGKDALEPIAEINAKNLRFNPNRFTLVLTNPPFGSVVKQTERPYLSDFELSRYAAKSTTATQPSADGDDFKSGKKAIKQRTSVKTEILFCERVWQFLKRGTGRAALVLPDGILTNSSLQPIRDWLIARFQLLAVVSLPQFAFSHYGAGVKASIVFLRKRAADEKPSDDEAIFMAAPARIGYDATGRKTLNDLPEVGRQYRAFQESPEPFFV
jgi:type I restriction enzyme M protein